MSDALQTPFLEGERLYLRGLLPQDVVGPWFGWFNDQEVCRHNSHGRFPNSLEKMEAFQKRVASSTSELVLAIVLRKGSVHVGNISLQGINWVDRSAEYAIVIGDRRAWGTGVGKEASDLIVRHGFTALNLHRIYCGTSEDNVGMQRLAAYMGMKEEGRRRQAIFKGGRWRDILEYAVLRDEWLARRKPARKAAKR